MGIDITLYAERRLDGVWVPTPPPAPDEDYDGAIVPQPPFEIGRPYELFSIIAGRPIGARANHGIEAIPITFEIRGLPDDLSPEYQALFQNGWGFDEDDFSVSWALATEFLEYDWDGSYVVESAYVASEFVDKFSRYSPFPENLPGYFRMSHGYWGAPEDKVRVSWRESLREFGEYVDWFCEEVARLGPPDNVRLIYGFS